MWLLVLNIDSATFQPSAPRQLTGLSGLAAGAISNDQSHWISKCILFIFETESHYVPLLPWNKQCRPGLPEFTRTCLPLTPWCWDQRHALPYLILHFPDNSEPSEIPPLCGYLISEKIAACLMAKST